MAPRFERYSDRVTQALWLLQTQGLALPTSGATRGWKITAIRLDDVRVPEASRLPGAERFKDAGRVLVTTRTTCAWGALGHAVAAYDAALTYSQQRRQFGSRCARFRSSRTGS